MIETRDECVGCPPGMGCLHSGCPYINVTVFICDECGDEVEDLYYGEDGKEYCDACVLHHIEKVEV